MISRLQLPSFQRPRGTRPRQARGFTLVEILTATAIMALLVSLVMTILNQVVTAWNRSSDDLNLGREARRALSIVTQDLQQAVFRSDGSQWFSSTDEQTPDSPIRDVTNTRLIFFTTAGLRPTKDDALSGKAGNPIYGDVCAVEYRITYGDPFDNQNSDQKTFSLHRVVVDPASTFYGINTKPIMGLYQGSGSGKGNLEDEFDDVVDNSRDGVTSSMQGTLGKTLRVTIANSFQSASSLLDNVARFNVFLYYVGTNPVPPPSTEIYPQTVPYNNNPAKYYFGGWPRNTSGTPTGTLTNYLDLIAPAAGAANVPTFSHLAFADLTITVLNDDGVALVNSINGAMPQGMTWEDLLRTYGKTYTQRVRFFNSP
jgi:prepilin-type N-terminal cleavage/methylation domain-containing protein